MTTTTIRRGTAVYDDTTNTITVTTTDGDTMSFPHDRLPGYVADTLAAHGWSCACPEATVPHFTPTGDGREQAYVVSHPMPDGWQDTLTGWVEEYGHLQAQVRGLHDRIRYLIVRPGDVLEGDNIPLELGDPNGMLFAQAGLAIGKAHERASATGEPFGITFAELINPELIEVPSAADDDFWS